MCFATSIYTVSQTSFWGFVYSMHLLHAREACSCWFWVTWLGNHPQIVKSFSQWFSVYGRLLMDTDSSNSVLVLFMANKGWMDNFTLRVTLLVSEKVKLLNRVHAGCGRKEPLSDPNLWPWFEALPVENVSTNDCICMWRFLLCFVCWYHFAPLTLVFTDLCNVGMFHHKSQELSPKNQFFFIK